MSKMRNMVKAALTGILAVLLLLAAGLPVSAQDPPAELKQYKGDRIYRYKGIHSGNKVRTVFYNYGLVGNVGEISGEWPVGTGNEYVGDVTILVGVEYVHPSGDTIHSVVTCKSPRNTDDLSPSGVHWGFEPLPGFGTPPLQGSEEEGKVAMSHLTDSWPPFWPDKMYSDPLDQLWQRDDFDPGWPGKWNGYFGKNVTNADQESYWQMDDNADVEFRWRENADGVMLPYYPSMIDTARGGMGIRVAARGFQWSHFLAEDVIIFQYEITNISDFNYDRVVFGIVVGTLAGGRNDTQDDLAFFDPDNDITYSYDNNNGPSNTPGWVPVNDDHEVGWIGYAFLESPGNEFDGIDNDGDSPNPSPVLTADILDHMANDTIQFQVGDPMILIDYYTYERTDTTMPPSGVLEYNFRDEVRQVTTNDLIWEDGHNGIDDNFNGLIDERFGEPVGGKRLDHVGKKYVDYFTGAGMDDPMIDEARDDGIDNDGDWNPLTDDVGADGVQGTGDFGENDGQPTLGEPHFDKTDIDESDQIGLTSFDYFNINGAGRLFLRYDEDLWERLQPGFIDVIPNEPMDGDFIYGSGYFPLPTGKTQRFSTALFFGEDSVDVFQNKITVQQIYDNNYNFARPPDKPTVTAVPGDGHVTLYWDDAAEFSTDMSQPVGYQNDFEGYKIYRATDPGFLENYVITDAIGRKVFHKPITQFDLDDEYSGFYPGGNLGISYYLGGNTGLAHVWTDSTVENGQTYYYAITSYDFGNDSLNYFPAETSKYIFVDETGKVTTDINTVVVVPGVKAAGYQPPVVGMATPLQGSADGVVYVETVDEREVPDDKRYRVYFSNLDTMGVAHDYSLFEMIGSDDSITVAGSRSLDIRGENRPVLRLFDESFDSIFGDGTGGYDTRSYFETVEMPVFNGMRMFLLTPRYPGRLIENASGWVTNDSLRADSMIAWQLNTIRYSSARFYGREWYADYEVEFSNAVLDTASYYDAGRGLEFEERELFFRVTNTRTGKNPMILVNNDTFNDGHIHDRSEILIMEEYTTDDTTMIIPTWSIPFRASDDLGMIYEPRNGDKLNIRMYLPFGEDDVFEFTPRAARVDRSAVDLSKIKVYPNPYLGANTQEPVNSYSSGRGERRVTFIHLPNECVIRIYTVRGELVKTLRHQESIHDGTENWNLRSEDGLDIAYGVYVFHVDSPYGEQIGKFAIIK